MTPCKAWRISPTAVFHSASRTSCTSKKSRSCQSAAARHTAPVVGSAARGGAAARCAPVVSGVYTARVNVRHHELDAFGRVHPGVYLRYLAHTAVEASTAAGFDAAWYEAAGAVWLVRRSTFTVLRPATAGEELEIRTWVEDFRRVRSHRRYEVRGLDGTLRLAAAPTGCTSTARAAGRAACRARWR